MAQAKVTTFYNTRKRTQDIKQVFLEKEDDLKGTNHAGLSIKQHVQPDISGTDSKSKKPISKVTAKTKIRVQKTKASTPDIKSAFETQKQKVAAKEVNKKGSDKIRVKTKLADEKLIVNNAPGPSKEIKIPRSPKRTYPYCNPEELSPTKKNPVCANLDFEAVLNDKTFNKDTQNQQTLKTEEKVTSKTKKDAGKLKSKTASTILNPLHSRTEDIKSATNNILLPSPEEINIPQSPKRTNIYRECEELSPSKKPLMCTSNELQECSLNKPSNVLGKTSEQPNKFRKNDKTIITSKKPLLIEKKSKKNAGKLKSKTAIISSTNEREKAINDVDPSLAELNVGECKELLPAKNPIYTTLEFEETNSNNPSKVVNNNIMLSMDNITFVKNNNVQQSLRENEAIASTADKEIKINSEMKPKSASAVKSQASDMFKNQTALEVLKSKLAQGNMEKPNDGSGAMFSPQIGPSDNGKENALLASEIKSKILSSGKQDGLKETVKNLLESTKRFKEYQSNAFKITSVIPPESNSKEKVNVEIDKAKSEPSYVKFHNLALPGTPSLDLPYKYNILLETFRCTDTIVSIMYNRKELIKFEKLRKGVEEMTRKKFNKTHLGQIMSVFPSAYTLHMGEYDPRFVEKSDPCLIVAPNFIDSTDSKNNQEITEKKGKDMPSHFSVAILLKRRATFKDILLKLVKKHHQHFLTSLQPPIHITDDVISRWHPKFNLNAVPNIEVASLPQSPSHKVCTARDVLDKIKGNIQGRIKEALESVSEKEVPVSSPTAENKGSKRVDTSSSALRGIDLDIIEKVRARQAAKMIADMTKSPMQSNREAMLERIPAFVHILRTYFISERRAAVTLDNAITKIIDSYQTKLTPEDVKKHLYLLAETFPEWLRFVNISKGTFVKIDKNRDVNVMLQTLPKH